MVKIRDAAVVVCGVQHSGSTNSKIRDCHAITEGEYYGVTIADLLINAVQCVLFHPKGAGWGRVLSWFSRGRALSLIVLGSGAWPWSVP